LGELSAGDFVIDLGAYAAITTMAFQETVGPHGRVVGVEADPFNLASAQCNLRRYANLRGYAPEVLNFAVWNKAGEVSFRAEGGLGSAVSELLERSKSPEIKVPALTLSDLVSLQKMQRVDLIKADIEGAEYAAFSDKKFFAKFRPRLVFELASLASAATEAERLNDLLSGYGYETQVVPQPGSAMPLVVCKA
jgi:FkbM family methyltransferase